MDFWSTPVAWDRARRRRAESRVVLVEKMRPLGQFSLVWM